MKKLIILVMVLVAYGASVSAASPQEYSVFYKLNNGATFNSLARYLNVDFTQVDQLKEVFTITETKLSSALKAENFNGVEKALLFNLGNTKAILSEDQYKKYLTVLNVTINNDKQGSLVADL